MKINIDSDNLLFAIKDLERRISLPEEWAVIKGPFIRVTYGPFRKILVVATKGRPEKLKVRIIKGKDQLSEVSSRNGKVTLTVSEIPEGIDPEAAVISIDADGEDEMLVSGTCLYCDDLIRPSQKSSCSHHCKDCGSFCAECSGKKRQAIRRFLKEKIGKESKNFERAVKAIQC
ncbi:MAG: hypothetical protein M1150_01480 [Patescibacteria group bacterium]|nr:hypothetical protein [Patescibacteria group bacterium]